ncbi:hypothetical protein ACFL5B_00585 [Candidatus Latescibacterota bacterium]
MKIYGPGMSPGKQAANQAKPASASVRIQGSESNNDKTAARLAALFIDKGIDIPPSQLNALETALSKLGMRFSELDGDSALRALLLHRHNIPLDSLLIKNTWENEPAVFERLTVLRELALTMLADKRFTGEMRTDVKVMLNDIDALFSGNDARITMKLALETVIETWAYALETRLSRLAEGKLGGVAELADLRYGEFLTSLDMLLHPLSEDAAGHVIGRFIQSLRDEVSELAALINQLPRGKEGNHALVREAVAALDGRLSVIAGELENFLGADGFRSIPVGLIADLFHESVRRLEQRLSAGFNDETFEMLLTENSSGRGTIPGFREALQKNGMAFEWRLLAWYRSGRDPARLRELMKDDLKGILLKVINDIKKHQGKSGTTGKIKQLEQTARNVVDGITRQQLANILNDSAEKRVLYFEIPYGKNPEKEHARIWTRGQKQPEENTLDSKTLSLSFAVKSSRLGVVTVSMTFSGKQVSLQFKLENIKTQLLAREMSAELGESLHARGYTIRSITFGLEKDETKPSVENQPGNMDIVG